MKTVVVEPVFVAERVGLSLDDCLLRKAGFRIHSRMKGQEPRWLRDGRVYTETFAVQFAKGEVGREKGQV